MSELPTGCQTCGKPRPGRYCANCGEKRVGADDHGFKRSLEHLLVAFTNADGKVFLTLRYLLVHPGRLTADYLRGRRKPFVAPLQLFLIVNLVFFLLHPLIGSDLLTTDLNTQLHYTWHHATSQAFVGARLAARGITIEAYTAIFDPAAVTLAKTLVVLVVPMFSLAVAALLWRQNRHYIPHLVFALHFCAFWLLLACATLALTNLTVRLLRAAAIFPSADRVSYAVVGFSLAAMTAYLYRAIRTVHPNIRPWAALTNAFFLGLALDLTLQAYRFTLFFITFWST